MTYLILSVFLLAAVWRWLVWRKLAKNLQYKLGREVKYPSVWKCRAQELETELVIERTRLAGVEKFLSLEMLVYSHDVGICVKNDPEKCCVPLDEAILKNLAQEVSKNESL